MVVDFDPVIISFGPIAIRWYALMYVVSFMLAGQLLKVLCKKEFFQVPEEKIDSLISTMFVGMFVGARTFYVFIYNWDYYQNHLNEVFAVWKGGLSFHGALTGLIIAGYVFAKRNGISWGQVMDCVALSGTPGLFFGRMGNFINGELYGRITDSPFGLIFPGGGPYPRHPSQLYEGFLEGIVLSIILWVLLKRVKYYGYLASTFLIGYGVFRFIVEYFREADVQLGYYFGGTTTMGQILCLIMIGVGMLALFYANKLKLEK